MSAIAPVKHSLRSLLRDAGFTFSAVITIALGIGATITIFSIVSSVLLKPVPYPEPDRLVILGYTFDGVPVQLSSPAKFAVWRQDRDTFEYMSAMRFNQVNRTDGATPQALRSGHVSADFFQLLGARLLLGRAFTVDEDRPSGGDVAILSHGFWVNALAGDRTIVGRTIAIDGRPTRIVGVVGPEFDTSIFDASPAVWLPIQIDPETTEQPPSLRIIARLKAGVSVNAANRQARVWSDEFRKKFPRAMKANDTLLTEPLQETLVDNVRQSLLVLLGAVVFLLLIACANVANLQLVRASARQRDVAIRAACGASPGRIAREVLAESLILSLAGGALGLAAGLAGSRALVAFYPGVVPRLGPESVGIVLDWRVLLFAVLVSVATGVMFGMLPMLLSARTDLRASLAVTSAGAGTGVRSSRSGSILIAAEIAVAFVLLVGAALLIRTFVAMRTIDRGFNTASVLTMRTTLPMRRFGRTSDTATLVRNGVERLRSVPGVAAAAASCCAPFESDWLTSFRIPGRDDQTSSLSSYRVVSESYFDALEIRLVQGRTFTNADGAGAPPVVVVNEAMARKFWTGRDALGARLLLYPGSAPNDEPIREVVGIIRDVRDGLVLDGELRPTVYVPMAQLLDRETANMVRDTSMVWFARTDVPPHSVAAGAERELRALTGSTENVRASTIEELIGQSSAPTNFNTVLLAAFGGSALLLAVIGVYGVTAYSVRQRRRELGVRLALGAGPGQLQRMMLGQALKLIAIGLVIGCAAALNLTRWLESALFGVTPRDPVAFAAVPLLLTVATLVAVWLPSRRGSRMNPLEVIRN
jgi:predicted permease